MSIYRIAKTSASVKVTGDKVEYPKKVTQAGLASLEPDLGDEVYVTNARKAGETAGNGTGILAYWGGAAWLSVSADAALTI